MQRNWLELPGWKFVSETATKATLGELEGFSSDRGHTRSEREVDNIVAEYCRGRRPQLILRVTRERKSLAIVGVAGVECGQLNFRHPTIPDGFEAIYISVVGVSISFRGEVSGLGSVLLDDMLKHIQARWPNSTLPLCGAVDPGNAASVALAEQHGFEYWLDLVENGDSAVGDEYAGEYDALYLRREGSAQTSMSR